MNKSKMLFGWIVLAALTLCFAGCAWMREIGGSQKQLDVALNHDGWVLTAIPLVDVYLDFEGTMVVETVMHNPRWAGSLRFCMRGRGITVQDMRDDENTPENKKQQLIAGSPPALHLAQAMNDFIQHHHGREAVNATLLRELLRGSRDVKATDLWKTWVDQPRRGAQRVLRKLEER